MGFKLQEMPGQFGIVVPFRRLAEFAAHEEEFFAGLAST